MNFGKPRRGQMHPLARLTNDQAARIREKWNSGGHSLRELARDAGVSHETIRKIKDGIAYTDS